MALHIPWKWFGAAVAAALLGAYVAGCSDDPQLICDDEGNCQLCDGYGCQPANPATGGGGPGGGSSTSSSSSGTTQCDPQTTACPCATTAECPSGTQCIQGLCIDGCDFSYECGPGKVCVDGACAEGCDATSPCSIGYKCVNGACLPDPLNPECSPQNPCPSGQICSGGFCTTGCTTTADCAPDEICDGANHVCIPDPSPNPVCGGNLMCPGVGQVCLDDGFCHYTCADVNQCKLIDNRFVACDQGVCKTAEEVDPECTIDNPCPPGKSCVSNKCL